MEEYEIAFKERKPGLHLEWMHHLGSVHIEIELSNQIMQLTCSPFQAALLLGLSEHRTIFAYTFSVDTHKMLRSARSRDNCS